LKSIAAQAVATAGLNNPVSTPTDYSTESRGKERNYLSCEELLGLLGCRRLLLFSNLTRGCGISGVEHCHVTTKLNIKSVVLITSQSKEFI